MWYKTEDQLPKNGSFVIISGWQWQHPGGQRFYGIAQFKKGIWQDVANNHAVWYDPTHWRYCDFELVDVKPVKDDLLFDNI